MREHASSDVADLARDVKGLAEMVRARTRRAYRDLDELRRLAAQMEAAAELLERRVRESDTSRGIRECRTG